MSTNLYTPWEPSADGHAAPSGGAGAPTPAAAPNGTSALPQTAAATNYQTHFDSLLHAMTDETILREEHLFTALSRLCTDFLTSASTYAQVICSEKHLPIEAKTIKPSADLGGFAGGEKYVCGGIVFRFAVDRHGLYGSDELAAKEAGHQLKGLTALFNALSSHVQELKLSLPLMTTIDFRGFRMVAMSLLPITKQSLVYGSHDAGRTILDGSSSPAARALAARVARALNLKPHRVSEDLTLFLPCDTEIHHSASHDKLYIVDYARFFCPEPPSAAAYRAKVSSTPVRAFISRRRSSSASPTPGDGSNTNRRDDSSATGTRSFVPPSTSSPLAFQPGDAQSPALVQSPNRAGAAKDRAPHLIRLLRPELVQSNAVPLSSDAFSHFGLLDRLAHEPEVEAAFARLVNDVIPEAAKELARTHWPAAMPTDASDALTGASANGKLLTRFMHERGVNMRWLGIVWRHTPHTPNKRWDKEVLAEATARCIKNTIRGNWRSTMRHIRIASITPFLHATQQTLNTIFGIPPCARPSTATVPSGRGSAPPPPSSSSSSTKSASPQPSPPPSPTPNAAAQASCICGAPCKCMCMCVQSSDASAPIHMGVQITGVAHGAGSSTATTTQTIASSEEQLSDKAALKREWWCTTLPLMLSSRFAFPAHREIFASSTPGPGCSCCPCTWRRVLPLQQLLGRVLSTCGIELSPHLLADVLCNPMTSPPHPLLHLAPFEEYDIRNLEPQTKGVPHMFYARATALFIRARQKLVLGSVRESMRLAEAARESFEEGLQLSSQDPRLLCAYGFLLDDIFQDPLRSYRCYRKSVTANPTHARSWYYLALWLRYTSNKPKFSWREMARIPEIRDRVQRLKDGRGAEATASKTERARDHKTTDKQGKAGSKASAKEPRYSDVAERRIVHAVAMDEAEMCLERAIEANPFLVLALREMATFQRQERKDIAKAEDLLRRALEVDDRDGRSLEHLASLLEDECGDLEGALEHWERCSAVLNEEPAVATRYALCRLRLAESMEEVRAALSLARAAVRLALDEDQGRNRIVEGRGTVVLWMTAFGTQSVHQVMKFVRYLLLVPERVLEAASRVGGSDATGSPVRCEDLDVHEVFDEARKVLDLVDGTALVAPPGALRTLIKGKVAVLHTMARHFAESCSASGSLERAEKLLRDAVAMDKCPQTDGALATFLKKHHAAVSATLVPGRAQTLGTESATNGGVAPIEVTHNQPQAESRAKAASGKKSKAWMN